MFGGRIAQTLRRLNDDEYPILIFSFGRGNANHETLELIKGKIGPKSHHYNFFKENVM